MQIKTYKFFNQFTRQAMFEKVLGYVDQKSSVEFEIRRLKEVFNLKKIYRFDLGESPEGCSPAVREFLLKRLPQDELLEKSLTRYPDYTYSALREKIAERFRVSRKWVIVSTGLGSIVDLITRVFFDSKDMFLMPIPSFYLFEEYSERMGAIPIFLELKEKDQFKWTAETTDKFKSLMAKFRPKIFWIANPNNPTGQFIEETVLEELIDVALSYNSFVVVDEAYGEYTDPPGGVTSAAQFVPKYENLMVLRTFSKKFGLAGIRVGYMMCSSKEIIDAMLVHRQPFPVTPLAVELALIALDDQDFLNWSQRTMEKNRKVLCKNLNKLKFFSFIPSRTSLLMIKNGCIKSSILSNLFKQRGIIVSDLNISGLSGKDYVRITVGKKDANEYFIKACAEIDDKYGGTDSKDTNMNAGHSLADIQRILS
jgi:histidinol-phosphate aminotransferase